EVVGPGEPEKPLREGVVPVHALGRLGHSLLVGDHERRVLVVEVRGHLVADQVDAEVRLEGDLGGGRERALQQRAEPVAHPHVVPRAADGPLLAAVLVLEAADVLRRPLRERDVAVLLLLARGRALDPDPGVVAQPHPLALVVVIDRLVGLVEGSPAAEGALLLDQLLEIAVGPDAIAELDRSRPLVPRSGPDRVDAGQPFGQAARADGAQGVHALHDDRRRDQRAPARAPRVVLVEVERAQVADGERQVVDRVARRLGAPRPAAGKALADAPAQLGDAFVGDLPCFAHERGLLRRSVLRGRGPSRRYTAFSRNRRWAASARAENGSSFDPASARTAGAFVKYAKMIPNRPSARWGTSAGSQPASTAPARRTATPCPYSVLAQRPIADWSLPSSRSARCRRRARCGWTARWRVSRSIVAFSCAGPSTPGGAAPATRSTIGRSPRS